MDRNGTIARAYGAAAVAIAIDGLTVAQAGPLLPVGSGLSLAAAGIALIVRPALAPLAARLAALVFLAWAIVLKVPLIAASPTNGQAWLGFVGLLALAAMGARLGSGRDEADEAGQPLQLPAWRFARSAARPAPADCLEPEG